MNRLYWPSPVFVFPSDPTHLPPGPNFNNNHSIEVSSTVTTSLQSLILGNTMSNATPGIRVVTSLPPDSFEKGEKEPKDDGVHGDVSAPPLKRAVSLGVPLERLTYHGLDVNMLTPRAPQGGLEGVVVDDIASTKSSLSRTGSTRSLVSWDSEVENSEDDEEDEKGKMKKGKWKRLKILEDGKRDIDEDEHKGDEEVDCGESEEGEKGISGNLDGTRSLADLPSITVSAVVTPHPSHLEQENPSLLRPITTAVTTYGSFVSSSPESRPSPRKSNLTQAILELQRAGTLASVSRALVDSTGELSSKVKGKGRAGSQRLLPKAKLREGGTVTGFFPTKARPTTATSYTELHSDVATGGFIPDAWSVLHRFCIDAECCTPKPYDSRGHPSLAREMERQSSIPALWDGGTVRGYGQGQRKRAPVSARMVCSTGQEFRHLWRDDLSFVSVDQVVSDTIDSTQASIAIPPPHLSSSRSRAIYSQVDGPALAPGEDELELLLFYPETVASVPPQEGMYCNDCLNGAGKCFCYYELRVEKCNICGRAKESCECWPRERGRRVKRLGEGRKRVETGYCGLGWESRTPIGLKISGVALRGGVVDEGRFVIGGKVRRAREGDREREKDRGRKIGEEDRRMAGQGLSFGSITVETDGILREAEIDEDGEGEDQAVDDV